MNVRNVRANEIDCRVGNISKSGKGFSLLLYKDARVDMMILDEMVGVNGWQRRHYECNGILFCEVGIKFDDEWIFKGDAGSESKAEPSKGVASDSFKRACVNFGIGRELYSAPFIWIGNPSYIKDGKVFEKFKVKNISYEDKKIVFLEICDSKNVTVYKTGEYREFVEINSNSGVSTNNDNVDSIIYRFRTSLVSAIAKDGKLAEHNIESLNQLSQAIFDKVPEQWTLETLNKVLESVNKKINE